MTNESTDEPVADTPTTPASERRRSRRRLCEGFAEVILLSPHTLLRGEIHDVSRIGCLVRISTKARVKVDTEADLSFRLKYRQFRVHARVARILPGLGIGFEFIFLSNRMILSIDNLITELERDKKTSAS